MVNPGRPTRARHSCGIPSISKSTTFANIKMSPSRSPARKLVVFATRLGWIALAIDGETLCQLTFAHRSAAEAIGAIRPELAAVARPSEAESRLVRRIRSYAMGRPEDFRDVEVDMSYSTPLGRRVLARCRRIPHGQTRSYGQLAAEVGRPRAARAVGNFLASNRTPIIVPCHRVVAAGGRLGGFTAPGGLSLKQKLIAMESQGGASS